MAYVRYFVKDVDRAVAFYTSILGFTLGQRSGPAFARVARGDLEVWLSGPSSSGARAMPDGRHPEPGGWNRFVIEVDALETEISKLRSLGVRFRNDIVIGPGGKQILGEDPDGNPFEIFEPAA